MSRLIRELANEERKKSEFLKKMSIMEDDFEKGMMLKDEQNKAFLKFNFLRKLNKELEKVNNVSRET